MTVQTLADVTPGSSATKITSSIALQGVWVTISAPSTNAGDLRVGGASVAAAVGAAIPKGTSFTFPRCDFAQQGYYLSTIYVYGTGSDVATITYGA